MSDQTDGTDDGNLVGNRSRRNKPDKSGRFAALQKFKKARTDGKRDFMIEEKSVYDIVEESEYSKLVQDRLEDDWIVDDGSGYVEDGREVFDDEFDESGDKDGKRKKGDTKEKDERKRRDPNIQRPGDGASIKSMFAASAATNKKRPKIEEKVSLEDDDILGDIMSDLRSESTLKLKPTATNIKKEVYNPFSKPVKTKRLVDLPKPSPTSVKPLIAGLENTTKPTITRPKPKATAVKIEKVEIEEPMDFDTAGNDVIDNSDNNNIMESMKKDPDPMMDIADVNFDDDFESSQSRDDKVAPAPVKCEKMEATTSSTNYKQKSNTLITSTEFNRFSSNMSTSDQATPSSPGGQSALSEVDLSNVTLVKNEAGDEVLRFYWLDAYEDQYNKPGTVYLFGKVNLEDKNSPVSCCLAVKNIERKIYLLPREYKMNMKTGQLTSEKVTMVDVYNEFNDKITAKFKINRFRSCKATREYAFEKAGIPALCDYMEVRYSAENPALPTELSGETFSHAFGTNQSFLESFLLERRLKGPSWLDIKAPQKPNPPISWCQLEIVSVKPDNVSLTKESLATPPLTIMSLCLKTALNSKTHDNEIVSIACLLHQEFQMDKPSPKQQFTDHFCAISKPSDCVYPFDFKDRVRMLNDKMKIEIMGSERHLLGYFLAKIHRLDPDIIVGHDIYGFELEVLLHRLSSNKVPHWSKIGRLKRTHMPKQSGRSGKGASFTEKGATCGRLICDVKISARELIRCKSYDLTELVSFLLHGQRSLVDPENIRSMYLESSSMLHLCETNLMDSTYILRLMYELNVIPLALQITNICGNVLSRTLMGGRSERNEYLLLHAFFEQNYILPDKEYKRKNTQTEEDGEEESGTKKGQGRKKPSYAGGLVLEPKKGFYDKYILLLDYNSLYPSIIQEYNICFTTINRPAEKTNSQDPDEGDLTLDLPDPTSKPGILPTEIRKLVQSRKNVKNLMKDSNVPADLMMQYDIRQKALKLTANSMYGCLGFSYSRFYAKPLAAMITGKGREILMATKTLAEKMNLEVIYGDTDSIMINTNCTDMETVFKLGNKVKNEVNKLYRLLEIDIDGVFKSILLLKKKKYAALSIQKLADGTVKDVQELKGLDIVRRDWCELSKQAGKFVVDQILSGLNKEEILDNIHKQLEEVGENVANGKVPDESYFITKQLTKNPEDYPDKKSLPHVQVALRVNSKGGKRMRSGDTVYYVICHDGSNLPASQRAYHPDELTKSDTLKIDTKYYLSSQVHPVVSRLLEPIEGTDAARIAETLGLDASGFKHSVHHRDDGDTEGSLGLSGLSDEERYKDCERLKLMCKCNKEIILDAPFIGNGQESRLSLSRCGAPKCTLPASDNTVSYCNQISLKIRQFIRRFYQGWLTCEDAMCAHRTRKLPLVTHRGMPECPQCRKGILRPEFSDSMLYNQLCFYQYIFDFEKALHSMPQSEPKIPDSQMDPGTRQLYNRLKSEVERVLKQNAYSEVDLSKLFSGMVVPCTSRSS